MKQFFQFDELGTNYRREIIGGLTTFLAMAYILFVNPITLALVSVPDFPDKLRIDQGAVFTATALTSAAGCILMGLIARYPIAIAPGMGLNAFSPSRLFLAWALHGSGLSGVFVSGLIFVALSLTGFREKSSMPFRLS
ncbi:solute carrier family 23 protein [Bacillus sp. SL00103]